MRGDVAVSRDEECLKVFATAGDAIGFVIIDGINLCIFLKLFKAISIFLATLIADCQNVSTMNIKISDQYQIL